MSTCQGMYCVNYISKKEMVKQNGLCYMCFQTTINCCNNCGDKNATYSKAQHRLAPNLIRNYCDRCYTIINCVYRAYCVCTEYINF